MKKVLSMILVGLMVFGIIGSVLAEEAEDDLLVNSEKPNGGRRFQLLKEFQDEIHQINALRIEILHLRSQVVEKHDTILDLYIEAWEKRDVEALKAAREVKQKINGINGEIKIIVEQIAAEKKAFREEVKNRNIEVAREHVNNIISLKTTAITKMEEKIELLDEIIDILSE
ncbi:MAG: hypothetical protein HPY70_12335 [Firmicutes bacterium]|jgi:hypothetical protein|nr:hypothetical protein [Bacillota bacterium]